MVKTIYLIAGKRLVESAMDKAGGLWANIGETERSVKQRLKDDDYNRKNSGGAWQVIKTWKVEPSVSDTDLHKILKSKKYDGKVKPGKSSNTEEFKFIGDDGTGNVAIPIIQKELEKLSDFVALPVIKAANKTLIQENKTLTKSNKNLTQQVKNTGNGDWLNIYASLLGELKEEKEEKDVLAQHIDNMTGTLEETHRLFEETMEEVGEAIELRENEFAQSLKEVENEKELIEDDIAYHVSLETARMKAVAAQQLETERRIAERLKKEISRNQISHREVSDKSRAVVFLLTALCVAALCFTWLVNSSANEELETLAIASEQQVEKTNLQLANAEKKNKTNLDKIAKLEEEAKKKVKPKKKATPKKKENNQLSDGATYSPLALEELNSGRARLWLNPVDKYGYEIVPKTKVVKKKEPRTTPTGVKVEVRYNGYKSLRGGHQFDVRRLPSKTSVGSFTCKEAEYYTCDFSNLGTKATRELKILLRRAFRDETGNPAIGYIPY